MHATVGITVWRGTSAPSVLMTRPNPVFGTYVRVFNIATVDVMQDSMDLVMPGTFGSTEVVPTVRRIRARTVSEFQVQSAQIQGTADATQATWAHPAVRACRILSFPAFATRATQAPTAVSARRVLPGNTKTQPVVPRARTVEPEHTPLKRLRRV